MGKASIITESRISPEQEYLTTSTGELCPFPDGEVRDDLDSLSKDNFGEFESTEWSIVFDQSALTAVYCHRENYAEAYFFQITEE